MSVKYGEMQAYSLTLDKLLVHAAKWHGDAEVVTADESGNRSRIGYASLLQRSRTLSVVLRRLGVQALDHVAIMAWNTQGHVEAWFAVMGMGSICHTLNPRLSEAHLVAMLMQSQPRLLIVSVDLLPLATRILQEAGRAIRILTIDTGAISTDADDTSLPVATLMEQVKDDEVPWGQFDENAPCGLCFTSGTTGSPKGVTYTHRGNYLHTLRVLQSDSMAISGRDTVLLAVPMFHANGWGVPFAAPAVGAKLVLPGRNLDGASLLQLINEEQVTLAIGIATVWLSLAEHIERLGLTGTATPALGRIIVGGASISTASMKRIEDTLGVEVQTTWGMTELSPTGTVSPPGEAQRLAHSSGRPALGIDLMLTDAMGNPLSEQRGQEGHLRVKGGAVIQRYFGQAQPATDRQGWFATGDLARIDDQGRLFIVGRAKDLIKSGGEWINPTEIEDVVGTLPEISLAAVIGRTHPKWGERPVLVLELREGCSIDDQTILGVLRPRVASWWLPDQIIRIACMPLAATGKIDKNRLRVDHGAPAQEEWSASGG